MTKTLRTLAVLTLALPTLASHAIELPREHRVPGGVATIALGVGSSRVDLQACKLEYSIVSPK